MWVTFVFGRWGTLVVDVQIDEARVFHVWPGGRTGAQVIPCEVLDSTIVGQRPVHD